MSFELVFLFAVFLLLLLLSQLLLRAARQRGVPTSEQTHRPPLQTPLPTRAPMRSTPVPVESGTVLRVAATAATPPGHTVAARTAIVDLSHHRNTRQRPTVVGVNKHIDLRRAIVLIAILARCRAINPYDSPQPSARG